jgi:hypothetical protein
VHIKDAIIVGKYVHLMFSIDKTSYSVVIYDNYRSDVFYNYHGGFYNYHDTYKITTWMDGKESAEDTKLYQLGINASLVQLKKLFLLDKKQTQFLINETWCFLGKYFLQKIHYVYNFLSITKLQSHKWINL